MKIIITGATGFLGLHLAEHLQKLGHEIWGIGRNSIKGELLVKKGCHFVHANLELENETQDLAFKSLFLNCDILIHSAAFSSPWGKKDDFIGANITATKNILNLAREYNIKRFIHISTPSLYFNFKDEMNITESKILSPPFASLYTASKYEAELLVDSYHRDFNLFTITLRPRGIFGPGDESLLPRLIKVAGTKGLPTIGSGKNIIDLTYVHNVVYAIEKAITAPASCNGQKYNITNGEPVQLWPFLNNLFSELNLKSSNKKIPFFLAYFMAFLLEILHKVMLTNSEPKLTRYTVGLLAKSQTLSIEKAKKELGYTPLVSMKEASDNVIKWWKSYES